MVQLDMYKYVEKEGKLSVCKCIRPFNENGVSSQNPNFLKFGIILHVIIACHKNNLYIHLSLTSCLTNNFIFLHKIYDMPSNFTLELRASRNLFSDIK